MKLPRYQCQVCGFHFRARLDGMIYRHFGAFDQTNPDGTCQGWGKPPVYVPDVARDNIELHKVLADMSVALWRKRAGV